MHFKLSSWLSLFAFLALFVVQAAAQGAAAPGAPTNPGTIRATRVEGTVKVKMAGAEISLVKGVDRDISQGSVVTTDANSGVVLLFSNGASISLGASSELNIVEFTQNPFEAGPNFKPAEATEEPSISNTNLVLTKGELVGNVKKLKKGGPVESKFTVGTPVGAAGIRGTTFRIVYRPDTNGRVNFILTTVEGTVELQIGSVAITDPQGVKVTDSKEVILNDVKVDATTNQVVATTATGQTVVVAAAPPSSDASVTIVQQVQAVAQILVQAVADKVFTSPTSSTTPAPSTTTTDKPPEPKKEEPPPPPTTTNQPSSSNPN